MMDGIIPYAMLNAVKSQVAALTAGMTYKGSVASLSNLPASATTGDAYTVTDHGNALYIWDGTQWVAFPIAMSTGGTETITKAQISALFV